MNINSQTKNQITTIELSGAVDLYSSPQARKAILSAMEDGKPRLVMINLSAVTYIDSSGVATLVEGLQMAKEKKCKFCLVGLSDAAREVFELARLHKVFDIFPSEDLALKQYGLSK